jgi:endopeptidase La
MIDAIIYIQRKYRLYNKIYNKINNENRDLYNHLYNLMCHINENYKANIISQQTYSKNITKLEDIFVKFKVLPINIKFPCKYLTLKQIRDIMNYIKDKIKEISGECGSININELLLINTNKSIEDLNIDNKNLLLFINKVFKPSNAKIYNNQNSKELILYTPKKLSIQNKDLKYIKDIKNPKCVSLQRKNNNIIEYVNGSRVYIPFNKNVLVMDGYFLEDPLNISRHGGTIQNKCINIQNKLKNIDISTSFKTGYVEQMSLRDLLVYSPQEIIDKINDAYNYVNKLKEKTISYIVKDFLNKDIEEQRDIITLFLLMEENVEIQYLAHLMYDMISNESYLLRPQPLAEQVYNSLHWSIQKIFKNAIKKISNFSKNIIDFDESSITYEKRICLLRVPENIKIKTLEKYKEILNKGGESSSKSQQYLDGLLRIPFEIYKKEYIIKFLEDYRDTIFNFNNDFKNSIEYYSSKNIIDSKYTKRIDDIYTNYHSKINNKKTKSKDINDYLQSIEKVKNDIRKLFNDENIIKDLNKTLRSYKINSVKTIINTINKSSSIKINCNDIKPNLIKNIITFINNLEDNILKMKYGYYIKNHTKNLHEINYETELGSNFNNICDKFNNINNSWKSYKTDIHKYIKSSKEILDKAIYSQNDAKKEIERIIAQWINGEMKGYSFGFEGPPGTGKTSLAKNGIAECLKDKDGNSRPFAFIAVGGSSNSSTLEGHSYTYVGSTWGKIVDILMETQCMNPIIYIDELDKISKTENGKEIIGILTHLTDTTQNDQFNDKYFSGINIDLSKVLFIFSYNDYSLLDPILADRIHRVKFNHLSKKDKVHIIKHYILPELLNMVGFDKEHIVFEKDVIEYIISNYTYEAGVRKLKEKIFDIVREVNLKYLTNQSDYNFPIKITLDIVNDIFSNKPKIIPKKIAAKSHIGLVNGLFATSVGNGGITIIETFKTPADAKLSLVLTGQQGDVMKESVNCAKTIAWNIIPDDIKKSIYKEWKDIGNWGIHVHCPEAATPKDGPSAGGAITLAIISLLCKIPVKNTVALTGEIDLNGSIHVIGGLDLKIDGGKNAGVSKILCPINNQQDLEVIQKTKPEILENIEIVPITNIWDILEHCLEDHSIVFNKYI